MYKCLFNLWMQKIHFVPLHTSFKQTRPALHSSSFLQLGASEKSFKKCSKNLKNRIQKYNISYTMQIPILQTCWAFLKLPDWWWFQNTALSKNMQPLGKSGDSQLLLLIILVSTGTFNAFSMLDAAILHSNIFRIFKRPGVSPQYEPNSESEYLASESI